MPTNKVILKDDRKEWYEIVDEKIKRDTRCAAMIFMKNGVINNGNGFSILKTNS